MLVRALLPCLIVCFCSDPTVRGQMVTKDFGFTSGNRTLSGIIDQPEDRSARALIIFVHGSGGTDIRGENRYADLRRRFVELGIACVTWDKPGQGRSEGVFDQNQPLAESAQEVIDAAAHLRREKVAGAQKIGLWSTSRGSWAAPTALARDPGLEFWISVSGASAEDNKFYLLSANLPLEGRTPTQTRQLLEEWKRGRQLFLQGADYQAYLAATETLRRDPAINFLAGDLTSSEPAYRAEQAAYLRAKDRYQFDESFSVILVPNFDATLRGLNLPVLALFGEKDTNMDWRKARALYQSTIGANLRARLTVRTFPDGNHSLTVSKTGSVREVEGVSMSAGVKADGYYDAQVGWLRELLQDRSSR